jgi:integrase
MASLRQRGTLRAEGNKWRFRYRVPGTPGQRRKQRCATLGDTQSMTRAQARDAADRLLERADPRTFHAGQVVTWRAWCRSYEARYLALLSAGTRASNRSILRRHLSTPFAGLMVHELDTLRVQEWILSQHASGAAAATVRARFNVLRGVLRRAEESGLAVGKLLVRSLRFPKDSRPQSSLAARSFSEHECERILAAAADPLRTAIALARFVGLRASEICGISWDAIDLACARIHVRQQEQNGRLVAPKSRCASAALGLAPVLADILARYRNGWQANDAGLLFAAAGRPRNGAWLRRELEAVIEALGIQRSRRGMHAFRHACALAMVRAGENIAAVQKAMRHADITTTQRYFVDISTGEADRALYAGAGNSHVASQVSNQM